MYVAEVYAAARGQRGVVQRPRRAAMVVVVVAAFTVVVLLLGGLLARSLSSRLKQGLQYFTKITTNNR